MNLKKSIRLWLGIGADLKKYEELSNQQAMKLNESLRANLTQHFNQMQEAEAQQAGNKLRAQLAVAALSNGTPVNDIWGVADAALNAREEKDKFGA